VGDQGFLKSSLVQLLSKKDFPDELLNFLYFLRFTLNVGLKALGFTDEMKGSDQYRKREAQLIFGGILILNIFFKLAYFVQWIAIIVA
jgi:hypothetical protein